MTTDSIIRLPVTDLKGVGPKVAATLSKLHIESLQDLLFHLPMRYEDRSRITPWSELKVGDHVMVEGCVNQAVVIGKGRRQLVVTLACDEGLLSLRFFHFTRQQYQQLNETGATVRCFGEVRQNRSFNFEMTHPEYEVCRPVATRLNLTNQLTPVYPTTQGLGQATLRRLMTIALAWLCAHPLEEVLPTDFRGAKQWMTITEALCYLHAPPVDADQMRLLTGTHPIQQRVAFEELLAHHLLLKQAKAQKQQHPSMPIQNQGGLESAFRQKLPFKLTAAQQRVVSEIKSDLTDTKPMLRLVQGDVGSGKTVVAALSALSVIESGYQVALMAPTEILAEQHMTKFSAWFELLDIKVSFLSGSQSASEKRQQLACIENGQARMVIGTHALFQETVTFKQLGLVIIDEQHRFGVAQRLALFDKGVKDCQVPHQLVMTATPIPRTLYMTAYADLDTSIIDELPPGRQPVETLVISSKKRQQVIERLAAHCATGQQVYWVCTLIEASEALEAQAATAAFELLQAALPQLRLALIHGRLKAKEKETIMQAFKEKSLDLIVATTVIEVGVDVPNATLMVIENPERLGLSQLHQLRGRVGRGSQASYCVLLYQTPLSSVSAARLQVMRESTDGFYIAEQDLKARGPGEVLGVRQSGLCQFRVADLMRDQALLAEVQQLSDELLTSNEKVNLLTKRWLSQHEKYLQG